METSELDQVLWSDYSESQDPLIKKQIVNKYLDQTRKLAASLYLKRPNNAIDFGDYYHYAIVGLLESIRTYKFDKNDNFFAYARSRIKGSILDGIAVMTEKSLQIKQRNATQQRLASIKGESRNSNDLFGDFINLSVSLAIGFILEADGSEEHSYYSTDEQSDLKEILGYCVDNINADERNVILYHYYYEVEFKTIAEIMGVSRSRIAQLHKSGIDSVREIYEKAQGFDVTY